MPPKSKTSGVSSSSFLDLKAEISKHQEERNRNKAQGNATPRHLEEQRKSKNSIWTRPNKGVAQRASRDMELEAVSKPTLESARAALERKAKIYDKLKKGKTGGLNDAQFDMLLVDFDAKGPSGQFESDSEDEDESLQVPIGPEESDPIIEYEDEFGRIRSARRSDVPRELLPRTDADVDEDEDHIIRNPQNHFPTYEPSATRVASIAAQYSEANNPLGVHYDASREVRTKGAGFYQFSGNEEARRAQMAELKESREETERERKREGAVDVRPGEIVGMRADDEEVEPGGDAGPRSKAMEKRKRDIEERRRAVDAKRRKKMPGGEEGSVLQGSSGSSSTSAAVVEAEVDPFARLEASKPIPDNSKGKGTALASTPSGAADDFLARLEADIMGGKR